MPILPRLAKAVLSAGLFFALATSAMAQAGSAGGSLGKTGKSASGGEPATERAAPSPKKNTANAPREGKGCGNFFGTWTSGGGSWLYGANDTVFRADGSARHTSGIVGNWTCSDGVIDLEWKDWDQDRLKLSGDGKRLDSLAGGKGFSR